MYLSAPNRFECISRAVVEHRFHSGRVELMHGFADRSQNPPKRVIPHHICDAFFFFCWNYLFKSPESSRIPRSSSDQTRVHPYTSTWQSCAKAAIIMALLWRVPGHLRRAHLRLIHPRLNMRLNCQGLALDIDPFHLVKSTFMSLGVSLSHTRVERNPRLFHTGVNSNTNLKRNGMVNIPIPRQITRCTTSPSHR